MTAHETFFKALFEILGVSTLDYSVENLIASFFLPLIIMFYAVYLLFEKIKIFPRTNIVSVTFGIIVSLLSLRIGNLAFWIGIFGVFALRLRGTVTRLLGLLIVALLYMQIGYIITATKVGSIVSAAVLFTILVILDKVRVWREKILYISMLGVAYWYLTPLLVGQIPSMITGIWIAAGFGALVSVVKSQNRIMGFLIAVAAIGLAFFLTQNARLFVPV